MRRGERSARGGRFDDYRAGTQSGDNTVACEVERSPLFALRVEFRNQRPAPFDHVERYGGVLRRCHIGQRVCQYAHGRDSCRQRRTMAGHVHPEGQAADHYDLRDACQPPHQLVAKPLAVGRNAARTDHGETALRQDFGITLYI